MVLQGADGTLFKEHMENCAPCHNPNIDTTVDPTLTTVPAGHACQICKSPGRQAKMLLCDYCLEGYHMDCLEPALKDSAQGSLAVPELHQEYAAGVTRFSHGDRGRRVGGSWVYDSGVCQLKVFVEVSGSDNMESGAGQTFRAKKTCVPPDPMRTGNSQVAHGSCHAVTRRRQIPSGTRASGHVSI